MKHGLRREKFKVIKNTEYTREDYIMITPQQLRRPFKPIFSCLQRGKALEKYRYLDGLYIVSIDGTGQYSSESEHDK